MHGKQIFKVPEFLTDFQDVAILHFLRRARQSYPQIYVQTQ